MTQPIIQVVRVKPEGSTQTVNELKRVRSELKGVAGDAESANQQASAAGSRNLALAQSVSGAAGGVLSTVGGSQVASVTSSILGLTSALGPVGAVAGVATAAFSLLQQEIEDTRQSAEDYANTLKSNADLVASGATTDDVQKQVQRLETARSFAAEELSTLTDYRNQIAAVIPGAFDESAARIGNAISRLQGTGNTQLFDNFNSLLEDISARTGEEIKTVAQLDAYIASVSTTTDGYTEKIDNLNRLLASGALAAADAEAAQKELNALYRELDQVYLDSATAALAADKLTSEQRQARIAEIDAEIASYRSLIDSGNLQATTVDELEAKISKLSVVQDAYRGVVESTADQLARVERANQAYNDFVEQSIAAADAVTKAGETVTKTQQEIADLEAASAAKRQEAETKHAEALAEIESEGAEERARIVADAADEIRRIERDLARSQRDAVRKRDVVASIQAREQAADALEDQKRNDDKQLATQEQAQRKQIASLQRAKQQELASVAEASNRELGIKRQALTVALNDLDSAKRSEQVLATVGRNALLSIEESFWKERLVLAKKYSGTSATSFPTLTESIANGTAGQPVMGGVTVNINGSGLNRRQVIQQVDTRLRQVWE